VNRYLREALLEPPSVRVERLLGERGRKRGPGER
jgi:hypothetical protein